MDSRHTNYLKHNGVDAYNCLFNRDKKREVVEIPKEDIFIDGMKVPIPGPMPREGVSIWSPSDEYRQHYDPFYHEYREGDNAVPRPPKREQIGVEPEPSHYANVTLEYIQEHGVLEFILESGYSYSLACILAYYKVAEYQMDYLRKLLSEGRLMQKVGNDLKKVIEL
jgi:hypothetical protein